MRVHYAIYPRARHPDDSCEKHLVQSPAHTNQCLSDGASIEVRPNSPGSRQPRQIVACPRRTLGDAPGLESHAAEQRTVHRRDQSRSRSRESSCALSPGSVFAWQYVRACASSEATRAFVAEVKGETGWDLYYFKGPNQHFQGAIQFQPLLESLLQKNLINGDRFLASVQLGNELVDGSGTSWVQDFAVVLNT
jgi:hypothetical protein